MKNKNIAAIAVIIILLTAISILATSLVVVKHQLNEELEYNMYQDSLIIAMYHYYNLTVDDVITDAEVKAAMDVEEKWLD